MSTKTPELTDVDAIIAAARPARAEVPVCLAGDLNAEHDRLVRELADLEAQYRDAEFGLTGDPRRTAAERVREVEQQMRAASHVFVVQAMPRASYVALRAKHTDGAENLITETFLLALAVASIVEPAGSPERLRYLLSDVLSAGQAQELLDAAWRVNTGAVDVPFSRLASAILGTRDSSQS